MLLLAVGSDAGQPETPDAKAAVWIAHAHATYDGEEDRESGEPALQIVNAWWH